MKNIWCLRTSLKQSFETFETTLESPWNLLKSSGILLCPTETSWNDLETPIKRQKFPGPLEKYLNPPATFLKPPWNSLTSRRNLMIFFFIIVLEPETPLKYFWIPWSQLKCLCKTPLEPLDMPLTLFLIFLLKEILSSYWKKGFWASETEAFKLL